MNINRLIANIESLNDNSTPNCVLKSTSPFPIPDSNSFFEKSDTSLSYSDNSLPEFESFSDHTEETSSGSTTTHANNSLPEYDSFHFEIEPDQDPANPDLPRLYEWHFRFGLDRYIWMIEIIYAYLHPNVENWMENLSRIVSGDVLLKRPLYSIAVLTKAYPDIYMEQHALLLYTYIASYVVLVLWYDLYCFSKRIENGEKRGFIRLNLVKGLSNGGNDWQIRDWEAVINDA
ncbi:hypothetical protein Tco_0110658 [Tanacetum coccineum]